MIGSHNTFTYLSPLKWWMKILSFSARCQSSAVDKQNIELADIRIKWYDGDWYVSHGVTVYLRLKEALDILKLDNIRHVRLLLEGNYTTYRLGLLETWLKRDYKSIQFYCGRNKKTWEKVLSFPDIYVEQWVGSMQSWYGKIFPWLWNKLNAAYIGGKYAQVQFTNVNALFDFV